MARLQLSRFGPVQLSRFGPVQLSRFGPASAIPFRPGLSYPVWPRCSHPVWPWCSYPVWPRCRYPFWPRVSDIRQLTDVLLRNLHETCPATDSDELPLFFYSDLLLKVSGAAFGPGSGASGQPKRRREQKSPQTGSDAPITYMSFSAEHLRHAHPTGGTMTLPRSNALAGRPSHVPHAVPPDAWRKTEGRSTVTRAAASDVSPLAGDSGREADSGRDTNLGQGAAPGRGTEPGRSTDSGSPHAERVWEQRRALGQRLAALRSRSGFSQWEFAPLTGYSRSTLSDAELGRHRLRRGFWQRCDEALMSEGVLTAAYDCIEALATAVRRSARIQAQAVREEKASRRLQALLPASRAEGLGGAGLSGAPDSSALSGCALGGPVLGGPAPVGSAAASPASSGAAAHPDSAAQPEGEAVPSEPAVMERCPHCHQPVAVIIVAAASPAGSPDG